ncbi:carboxymuconolactone decarboxylase family protein [Staphylococcus kloosii]|uniref:carboxymuconolactone decarboxylase family protein n=1 Tax=Staphylococcus kloosii TaxID=29384 RepID=UPI00189FAC1F|nr:carboxymuconolactone decarboxylase family protein [Staphylococcus kloosii]MBF7020874.1 carboxymuconolactone decarboxylase family protein [Staphylococcus kloosii]
MEQTKYQQGMDKLMEYTATTGSTHLKIADELKYIAPDASKYIIEFAYGEIYSRSGLTNQQRALVTVASLITQGTEPQLELHINTALTSGITAEEIVETITQLIPYTGFPRVLNALSVAQKVFKDREITVEVSKVEQ